MDNIAAMCDNDLLSRFAKGHNEAMQVLVERYKAKLFSYIYYTVKDRVIAEDIFQDVFFKVIVSLKHGRYEENGKFFPWLTRIAHNLIIVITSYSIHYTKLYDVAL